MLGAELNEILQYDLYIDTNLQNFIACRTSHALLSHMENYHMLAHHNFIYKTIMPGCRCTNKESCSIKNKHQSESASHTPPSSKELIALTQILESAPELYHINVDSDFI